VGNIRIEGDRPVWLHHCEQCMACIQLCPTDAIQAGKTEGRRRYRNPEIRGRHAEGAGWELDLSPGPDRRGFDAGERVFPGDIR
ncbi:MAG: 4Fe-4S binding protein, partial [Methanoregulaceae archaeon]|nr:4Fe-4S binding protein [Methanoregulaceae archaeon]